MVAKNDEVTIRDVYTLLQAMEKKIDKHYVTKNEFRPVKTIVYGMTGLILTTVLVAILAGVITKYAPIVLSRGGM